MTGVHIANRGGNVVSYLKDYHGNIVGKTTVAGAMVEEVTNRMDYDAFGNQWVGNTPYPFGYCGEYYDSESRLIYLRNRYYDSATGRFITEDPAKDGVNWYSYCSGNPIMLVDPSGLCEKCFESYDDYQNLYEQEDIQYIFANFSSNHYLQVSETSTYYYICAYIKINPSEGQRGIRNQYIPGSNCKYRQAIAQGIISSWSGIYNENGVVKRVRTCIVELADGQTNQKALEISLHTGEMEEFGGRYTNGWTFYDGRSSEGKKIDLWLDSLNETEIKNIVGHEFGHVLGLEDVYNRKDILFKSIMCYHDDLGGLGAQQIDYDMLFKHKTWTNKGFVTYDKDLLDDDNNEVVYY